MRAMRPHAICTNRYTAFVENQKTEMKKWQIDGEFPK